jgi:hypothetical protein
LYELCGKQEPLERIEFDLNWIVEFLSETWHLLLDASVYILLGLLISGLLRVFLSPQAVARHLGQGRFKSVLKAALIGIPIPL